MDYHAKNISEDGVLWIPIDGFGQNNIQEKWPIFKDEHRNVRLSLESDGLNPFEELRSNYLVWFAFIINNNLPPSMSIKRDNTMLAMIIWGNFF